jgi:predicted dienelactone hydrolase
MALLTAAGACGGDGSSEPSASSEPDERSVPERSAPYEVATLTETFVDDSRPIDDPQGPRSAPERTLETHLYVPEGEGPFPLVVHAHGFDGHPRKYIELATTWAEAGYVVALPAFPLTNDATGAPGILADYVSQPADVAFVIDEVLALSAGDHPMLGGRVDEERIAVSGHSLGGATAYGLTFNDCCRDERVDAVILMSTLPLPFGDDTYTFEGVPLLLLQITEDPIVPYDNAETTYDAATSPKFLVGLEGAGHFEPYEDAPSPHDDLVKTATTAFWDAYLYEDPDAPARLIDAAESSDSATVTASP